MSSAAASYIPLLPSIVNAIQQFKADAQNNGYNATAKDLVIEPTGYDFNVGSRTKPALKPILTVSIPGHDSAIIDSLYQAFSRIAELPPHRRGGPGFSKEFQDFPVVDGGIYTNVRKDDTKTHFSTLNFIPLEVEDAAPAGM